MEAAKETKDLSFEEKQKELIEKWNAVWGKKEDKKEEPKPAPKVERPPVVHYCEGGLGFLCPNKATIHVYCDTDALYYQQYLCASCWKWNHLFGKRADELPEGLRIFKIEGSTEVLEAGRARSKLESKLPPKEAKAKEEKKTPLLESKGEIAFIFPGQGAQEVGMTKDIQSIPGVKQLFETASSVLGYDLADLVLKGPKEKLDTTEFSQPAMLIAGLAAIEKLRTEDEKAVTQCAAVAGLSLGEYTALVFAGALSLEDALKVVKVRGQAMNKAALSQKGGMVSVVGLDDAQLNKICEGARAYAQSKDTDKKQTYVCEIANLNFPSGRVVSGHDVCMEFVVKAAEEKGAKASKLHVSGAFHTELMSSASKALEDVLHDVVVKNPRIPVYANTTGEVYKSAEDIRTGLVKQLVSPVRWEQCVDGLLRDGRDHLFELGPRNQLSAMVRKQNPQAYKLMKNIRV